MAPRHDDYCCFVPPDPDALARQKAQLPQVQGEDGDASILRARLPFSDHSSGSLGLNDGFIFPKEHFEEAVPVTQMTRAALERVPLQGSIKVAIVLVEFQDKKMATGTKKRFEDLFFSTGVIPTGSLNEYYGEVSNHKVSFSGQVVGPFTLDHDIAYYAAGQSGRSGSFPNTRTMAAEALDKVNGSINFKPYDNDGNGFVDAFVVVHAGRGAEQTLDKNDIWSVKWVLPQQKAVDGVNVYGFLTLPEDAKLGVSAHELGHLVFGFPDLYDTDNSSYGIGNWCLMSYGSWGGGGDRPVHASAWCKAKQGWVDVVNENDNHTISLEDVKKGYRVHRLWKDGDKSSSEYFLIENRQLTGYDKSLPADGLLVWHIDDSVDSNVNENHPKVGLVQADGLDQLQKKTGLGDAGDPFPGVTNNATFNSTSTPNSKSYAGTETFVSINRIPKSAPLMMFYITVKAGSTPYYPFDPKMWHRIRNTLPGLALDVVNDGAGNKEGLLNMKPEGNFSGQYWQIVARRGTWALRTLFLKAGRQLDVYGNDKTKPHLGTAGDYSGQYWMIDAWGDGTWNLSNLYGGRFLYLDTPDGGSKVAMTQANPERPTQRWTITPIRPITESGFDP